MKTRQVRVSRCQVVLPEVLYQLLGPDSNLLWARRHPGNSLSKGRFTLKPSCCFPKRLSKLHSLPSPMVRARDPDGDEVPASLELIW